MMEVFLLHSNPYAGSGWNLGNLGRDRLFLLGVSLILCLATAAGAAKKSPTQSATANPGGGLGRHPSIEIQDFKSQVTRNGLKMQQIQARSGRMDETERILDLKDLRVKFFDAGTTKGEAVCGTGRVWLMDRPKEKISNHDILLKDRVTYHTSEGWIVQTPQMRYTKADSMLRSDKGYLKQMPDRDQYLIGRGQGFAVKLLIQKSTFERWEEYGNPAILEKSKEPVIKP